MTTSPPAPLPDEPETVEVTFYSRRLGKHVCVLVVRRKDYDALAADNARLQEEWDKLNDLRLDEKELRVAAESEVARLRKRQAEDAKDFLWLRKEYETLERQLAACREALQWYGERASDIERYMRDKKTDSQVAINVELSLDAGKRARAALQGDKTA